LVSILSSFTKYSGCGNDFILIDNREKIFPSENSTLICRLCHRSFGIGADGVILLENSPLADFRMRIFNADSSEAEMCGNGVRCLLKFIQKLGFQKKSYLIEAMHQNVIASFSGDLVSVTMPRPKNEQWWLTLRVDSQPMMLHSIDTGVPHVVIFVDDIKANSLMAIAPKIRFHPYFAPKGTNVNFAATLPSGEIAVRTYERGVEQETLACGTGAVAVALAAVKIYGHTSPIKIHTQSQEILEITLTHPLHHPPILLGPVNFVYQGQIDLTSTCSDTFRLNKSVCI
jgi:diaminopimelate epimerase